MATNWIHRLFSRSTQPDSHAASLELLSRARALVAAGDLDGASTLYWKIKRRELTPELLVEHAEVLVLTGDIFRAASRAADALTLDPNCDGARAVQAKVRRLEAS